jgi:hypothetical protein
MSFIYLCCLNIDVMRIIYTPSIVIEVIDVIELHVQNAYVD